MPSSHAKVSIDFRYDAERDPGPYPFVDQLKRVPASAFVAVDASACRVASGSAAFACGPGCPAP